MSAVSAKELPGCVESACFAAEAKRADVEELCAEAREKSFRAVCVNGCWVELARTLLDESPVQVVALVGFPLGASDADSKRYETEIAVDLGAHEIDFVINLGRFKDGDHKYVLREMRDIAEAADERIVKVILETHLLTRDEKILACQLALDSGVQCVVTATDFHSPNVATADIQLLRETLGETFGIKAAGNIRGSVMAMKLLEAGATRIGSQTGALE